MNSSLGSACLPCGGCHGTRSGGVGPYLPTMLRPIVRGGAQLHRPLHAAAFHTSLSHNSVTVLSTKKSEQTYHPRGYENSMGYRRARKPYLVRNTIGFLLISGFIVGVYAYSIMMVCVDEILTPYRWNRMTFLTSKISVYSQRRKWRLAPPTNPRHCHPQTLLL